MAISKRLRFEILRRDNHTCQYCGEIAPSVTLHVDHVKPKALGGTDGPENLVAACKDCNAGKASTILASEHAQEIASRNVEWELHAQELSAKLRGTLERDQLYVEDFEREWAENAQASGCPAVWPAGYQSSIYKWAGLGYPMECLELAIGSAYSARRVADEDRFTYLAGIVWKQIREAQIAMDEVEEPHLYTEAEHIEAYMQGCNQGHREAIRIVRERDVVALVVDGPTASQIERIWWDTNGANPVNQTRNQD